jgi:hypothetical protein
MRLTLAALAFYASVAVGRSQPLNADTIERTLVRVAAKQQTESTPLRVDGILCHSGISVPVEAAKVAYPHPHHCPTANRIALLMANTVPSGPIAVGV